MKNYPSLETCRKISHLFDETEMYWFESPSIEDQFGNILYPYDSKNKKQLKEYIGPSDNKITRDVICSAPNISELLERLPEDVPSENGDWHLKISRTLKNQYAAYYCIDKTFAHGEYLPEALGQLLIKLDEEKLL